MQVKTVKRLGELLLDAGIIDFEQLENALTLQTTNGKKLGEVLVDQGIVDERKIAEVLEFQLRIPFIDLSAINIDNNISSLISENLARKYSVIPIRKENNELIIAMADPLDLFAIEDIRIATSLQIKPGIATRTEIINAIDRHFGKESAEKAVEDFKKEYDFEQIEDLDDDLLSEVDNAPVVRLVNSLIQHAIKARASDIHVEPLEDSFRVRFRIDGELQEIMKSSKAALSAIVTRIKIIGRMDIAEKRLPQDGRVEMNIDGKDIDMRLSVLPTVYGEKVVMRILGRSDLLVSKSELGFTPENEEFFNRIIKSSNGIILLTGPTGSGKTSTMYTILNELNKTDRNIITVEDPVEYKLEGINQVQVNLKAGLTFASGLRSILRQDPDIIMIGEIRDSETAQIAVRAAITGHLVLSTVHTNDSASTVSRLADMGIEPYLLSSSLVGIIAQRLVRKICRNCITAYNPDHSEMMLLKLKDSVPLYRGEGCTLCNYTGYKGRTAIHEVMLINREIRDMIERRATIDQLRQISARFGMKTLRENCVSLVLNGTTTVEELIKVTYSID